MLEYRGYIGTVEPDDGTFSGRVIGLRDVITFEGVTFAEVEQAFRDSIDDYLAFCAEPGEAPDRAYSGNIPLRVHPEVHRSAALRAQAEGLSLNQWITRRISSRQHARPFQSSALSLISLLPASAGYGDKRAAQ